MLLEAVGWLGLALVSARVGVHVERLRGLEAGAIADVASAIEDQLATNGRLVVVDEAPPSLLDEPASARLMMRLRTDELLVYSVFVGPNTVRVTGERIGSEGKSLGRVEVDESVGQGASAARAVVGELFPPLGVSKVALSDPAPPKASSSAPWIFLGSGSAAMTAGLGLAIHAGIVRSSVATEHDYSQGGADRLDAASRESAIGTGFLMGGATLIVTGVVWLLMED